jgi:hypothetical protein
MTNNHYSNINIFGDLNVSGNTILTNLTLTGDTTQYLKGDGSFGNFNLSNTLSIGNTTDGNNIIVSDGDKILSPTGSTLNINDLLYNTGTNIGIGTTTPGQALDVVGLIRSQRFGANGGALFLRTNGTISSPTAVNTNNVLGSFGGNGFNGVGIPSTTPGQIRVTADENFTTTANGTRIEFLTTTNGTTTLTERLRITNAGNVGIGTTSPGSLLNLSQNGSTQLLNDGFSDTTGTAPQFVFRRARGAQVAPTALLGGNLIGLISGRGHDGTDFTVTRASIAIAAAQNWTTTANGTNIRFSTTENGTTTNTERVRILDNGDVGIGTITPTERLDVNGNVKANRFIGVSDIQRMPFKQNTSIAHTGTLTNTVIASYLIPAGTFEANDILRFNAYFTQTNNANVKTARIYVNTTPVIAGAILIATRTLTSSAGSGMARELVFKNSLSSQDIVSTTGNILDSESANNTSVTALSINFSVDQHIIIAVELADITDTVTLRWLRSEILR